MDNQITLNKQALKLIIRYTHNLLTEDEKDALDKWITESDENLELFEELTAELFDNVFDPNQLIIETEDLLDLWMISGLLARQMENIITPFEKERLDEWVNTSDRNKEIYNCLNNAANLQKFLVWLRQRFKDVKKSPELN